MYGRVGQLQGKFCSRTERNESNHHALPYAIR